MKIFKFLYKSTVCK